MKRSLSIICHVIGISPCRSEHLNHLYMSFSGRFMQRGEATGVFVVDPIWILIDQLLHLFHVPCRSSSMQRSAVERLQGSCLRNTM